MTVPDQPLSSLPTDTGAVSAAPDQPVDDQDHHATEVAVAAAILLLLMNSDGNDSTGLADVHWGRNVRNSFGNVVKMFGTRSGVDLGREVGVPSADTARIVEEALDRVYDQTMNTAARWIEQSAKNHPGDGNLPGVNSTIEDKKAYETAANSLARSIVTMTRETMRESVAKSLGAIDKTWRTRKDADVRSAHAELEGQTVPIDKPFDSALGPIMFPGDPDADISNTAGCRCHNSYSIPNWKAEL